MRCFSCGKPVADHYEEFVKRVQKKEDPEKVLDNLGISRYCCRRTLFAHVELIDLVMKYQV